MIHQLRHRYYAATPLHTRAAAPKVANVKGNRRHPLALRTHQRRLATSKLEWAVTAVPATDAEVIAAAAALYGCDTSAFVITPQWVARRRDSEAIRQQIAAARMSDRAFRLVAIAAFDA